VGVRVGVAIFKSLVRYLSSKTNLDQSIGIDETLDQSIGIDETNTFQLTFFSSMDIVGATVLGGLWA